MSLGYALQVMDQFGRLALVGEHRQTAFNPSVHFIGRELTMTSSRYYHHADYDEILQLLAGGLHPERMVTHRISLSEAPEAFHLFDTGQAAKVVLQP
jgi:threonine dehydrogenase-like Zn-dependent dehydrogenase